jgi:hypothetical protein
MILGIQSKNYLTQKFNFITYFLGSLSEKNHLCHKQRVFKPNHDLTHMKNIVLDLKKKCKIKKKNYIRKGSDGGA